MRVEGAKFEDHIANTLDDLQTSILFNPLKCQRVKNDLNYAFVICKNIANSKVDQQSFKMSCMKVW